MLKCEASFLTLKYLRSTAESVLKYAINVWSEWFCLNHKIINQYFFFERRNWYSVAFVFFCVVVVCFSSFLPELKIFIFVESVRHDGGKNENIEWITEWENTYASLWTLFWHSFGSFLLPTFNIFEWNSFSLVFFSASSSWASQIEWMCVSNSRIMKS